MKAKQKRGRGRPRGSTNRATPEQLDRFGIGAEFALLKDSEKPGPDGVSRGAYGELALLSIIGRFGEWRNLGFTHAESTRLVGGAAHMPSYYRWKGDSPNAVAQNAVNWARDQLKREETEDLWSYPSDLPREGRPLRLTPRAVEGAIAKARQLLIDDFRVQTFRGMVSVERALRVFANSAGFGFRHDANKAFAEARKFLIEQGVSEIELPRVISSE